MKTIRLSSRIAVAVLLIPFAVFMQGCGPAESGTVQQLTQNPGSPSPPATPPELFKPDLPPSELNNADAVFKKLDVTQRGYVTLDDASDLLGFEEAFRAVDTTGAGKLTPAQFRKAWSIYKARQ